MSRIQDHPDYKLLAAAKRSLPYRGQRLAGSSKISKLTGCCPHCGAPPPTYGYRHGRFKECISCDYDRMMERYFTAYRAIAKRGGDMTLEQLQKAVGYWKRVYGGGDGK